MRFFKISTESDPKIIGVNNGIHQVELLREKFTNTDDYDAIQTFFDYTTYWDSVVYSTEPNFNFEYFSLLKKAKVTSIISFSPFILGCSFIINREARQLLDEFNVSNSYFFPASIYTFDGQRLSDKYSVLYTSFLGFEAVDFSKSIFYTGSQILGKKYLELESHEKWKAYCDTPDHLLVQTEKVAIKKEFANADILNKIWRSLYI